MHPERPSAAINESTWHEATAQPSIHQFEKWSRLLQEEIDGHKVVLDTFYALLPVAAFIAGIQAQVIAFSIVLPKSTLGRTANVFAFVGLFLDVIGTASGVAHSLVLQHKIKETTTLQSVNSRLKKEAVGIDDQIDESARKRLEEFKLQFDRFARVMDKRYPPHDEIMQFVHLLGVPLTLINMPWIPSFLKNQIRLASSIVNLVQAVEARSDISGPSEHLAPVATMVLGIVFLVISVLLVAVGSPSLSKEVWIACTVTAVLLTAGMIPPALQGIMSMIGLGKALTEDEQVIESNGSGRQIVQVIVGSSGQ